MEEKKKQRGGQRKGAGRPKGKRTKAVTVKLSEESIGYLQVIPNKSQYLDNLIIEDNRHGND